MKNHHRCHIGIHLFRNLHPLPQHDFQVKGVLVSWAGEPLPFYQVMFFDKDRVEDDLLGCAVTDEVGVFATSFSRETFQDVPLLGEQVPNLLLRVAAWERGGFYPVAELLLGRFAVEEHEPDRVTIDLGALRLAEPDRR